MKTIVDTLGNEFELKTDNDLIFYDLITSKYVIKDIRIAGKLYHTYRVANYASMIARKLNIDEELSYNIGLLHDYARFPQWEKYQSFDDHATIDHGDESSRLLFELNEIEKFNIDKKYYTIINLAVKNHNKKEIEIEKTLFNEEEYNELMLFSKLIRDADKIDILYRLANGDINFNYSIPGVSDKVLQTIKNHECVDKKDIKTSLDKLITIIGYIYDFNLDESLDCVNFDSLWEGILQHYGSTLSKEDRKTLEETIDIVNGYVNDKKANIKLTSKK